MPMKRLSFKGGYGEHGRSCFLVQYDDSGRCYMVDCGIMDEDPFPYPSLSFEELECVDYLFLTHCHKDHSGAIHYICENGFHGTVITSEMTGRLDPIPCEEVIFLPVHAGEDSCRIGGLDVRYGRSGHCPGGLWFLIRDALGSCFFSGDYQENTILYACDRAEGLEADLAVVDCAHVSTDQDAESLRMELRSQTEQFLAQGRQVVFPVPKYGRGLEMYCLLRREFPDVRIRVDKEFIACSKKMMKEECWYQEQELQEVREIVEAAELC